MRLKISLLFDGQSRSRDTELTTHCPKHSFRKVSFQILSKLGPETKYGEKGFERGINAWNWGGADQA